MKRYFRRLILFAVPLAVLTFCLVTGKAEVSCDGDVFTAYGFPAFWITPGATSLAQTADLIALFFDAAIYFSAFAAMSVPNLFDKFFGRRAGLISACLWTAAVITGGCFLIFLSFDLNSEKLVFFPCEQGRYLIHFGFPFNR